MFKMINYLCILPLPFCTERKLFGLHYFLPHNLKRQQDVIMLHSKQCSNHRQVKEKIQTILEGSEN